MMVVIMVVLHSFDRRLLASTKVVMVYVEVQRMDVIRRLNTFAKENQIVIDDVEIEKIDLSEVTKVSLVITLRLPGKMNHTELIE